MTLKNSYNPELITPIKPKHPWRILSDDDLRQLTEATYTILEDVGVHFPLQRALEIFADNGADVDFKNQIVRMCPDLVNRALSTAPRYFQLGGRDPEFDFHLQENHTFYSNDGCFPAIVDLETRQKRRSVKDDVAKLARLVDYLKPLSYYWPMVSAGDYGATAGLHEIHASFLNCRKHTVNASVVGETPARYALEMALAVSGDEATLRQRPPLMSLACTIDPLGQDPYTLEGALVFAEAGIPVGVMAMNTMMSTGPATVAGSLALGNAEVISGAVLLQLAYPGTPVYHSILIAVMDPHTGGYLFHSTAADAYFGAAIELGQAFNLPVLGSAGGSDALSPGWQSGKEGHAAFISALLGSELVIGVGGMASATVAYPEYLILDCDQFNDDLFVAAGIEVNSETLALDVIKNVGPRGNFLMEPHTLKHMREIPLSEVIMETRKKGREHPEGVIETAREKTKWILENHQPEPLDKNVQVELDRIITAAEKEIKGK